MSGTEVRTSWLKKLRTISRRWIKVGVALGLVLLVAYAGAFLIDEPLRRYTEVIPCAGLFARSHGHCDG